MHTRAPVHFDTNGGTLLVGSDVRSPLGLANTRVDGTAVLVLALARCLGRGTPAPRPTTLNWDYLWMVKNT